MRLQHRWFLLLLCFALASPALIAEEPAAAATRDDQAALVAPTLTGELGLFTTVSADTLRRGGWSFGINYQSSNLFAAPARAFDPPSARSHQDMGYDLYRLNLSAGYGLTDRWDVSVSVPWDRIQGQGGDRAGFINGWLYQGKFLDSALGDVHLATKFGLTAPPNPSRLAVSVFADLPTGNDKSGIASGETNFGAGLHWTHGMASLSGSYTLVGKRSASRSNLGLGSVKLPNELHLDGGLNVPLGWFRTTNWINEVNGVWYTGGDVKPRDPIFLVTGLRHWFGDTGWSANAGLRFNVAKFSKDHSECAFTEIDNCSVSGLVGLAFTPSHYVAPPPPPPPAPVVVPPPPPAPEPPPPPPPAPVPPPEPQPPVPPKLPTVIREDEIHFEPGSARITNIGKAILDEVALRMKQEPSATATIIGYTDDREATGPVSNLDVRRAEAAKNYLVTRHGIDPTRIAVEGRDGREPVGDNNTAQGRLKNRRVVVRLLLP